MDNIADNRFERRRQQMIRHNSTPVYRPSNKLKNVVWFSAFFIVTVCLIVYAVSD